MPKQSRVGSRQSRVGSRQSTVEQSTVDVESTRRPTTADYRLAGASSSTRSVQRSTAAGSPSSARPANTSTSRLFSSPTAMTSSSAVLRDRHRAVAQAGARSQGGRAGVKRRWSLSRHPGTDEWTGRFDVGDVGWHEYSDRRMGRPVRDLAPRHPAEIRRRPGRLPGASRRRTAGSRGGGARGSDRQRRPDAANWLSIAGRCARRRGTVGGRVRARARPTISRR